MRLHMHTLPDRSDCDKMVIGDYPWPRQRHWRVMIDIGDTRCQDAWSGITRRFSSAFAMTAFW